MMWGDKWLAASLCLGFFKNYGEKTLRLERNLSYRASCEKRRTRRCPNQRFVD